MGHAKFLINCQFLLVCLASALSATVSCGRRPGQDCILSDCLCVQGARHCEGNSLLECAHRVVDHEDGLCGSICEYPLIEECLGGCIETGDGDSYCASDSCGLQPEETYDFLVTTSLGDEFGCHMLAQADQVSEFEISGSLLRRGYDFLTVLRQDGVEATFEFNIGDTRYVSCIGDNMPISASARFEFVDGQYCVRELTFFTDDVLIIYAKDGDWRASQEFQLNTSLVDIGCPQGAEGSCGHQQVFGLEVSMGAQSAIVVEQGKNDFAYWDTEHYQIINLRSHYTGECNDDWGYAFAVLQDCLTDL